MTAGMDALAAAAQLEAALVYGSTHREYRQVPDTPALQAARLSALDAAAEDLEQANAGRFSSTHQPVRRLPDREHIAELRDRYSDRAAS